MVVTTVPAKKKLLPKSQLLGLVELPLGFTPFTQASMMTCGRAGRGSDGAAEPRAQQGAFVAPHLVRLSRWSCFLCPEKEKETNAQSGCTAWGCDVGWWRGMGPRRQKMLKGWTRWEVLRVAKRVRCQWVVRPV